jgi:molybdopterin-guanine dinucleotide biosynthesis protein B
VKRIHIVGTKNSGKTTLVVELAAHYTSLGYRVGTIKHTHHRHELDTPGKDSYRHRQAGAAVVGILSPALNAVFWSPNSADEPGDPYEDLAPAFGRCDFVLVEGHYQIEGPKVEVWRSAASEEPLAKNDQSILAVITDDPINVSVPVWSRSDINTLGVRILEKVTAPGTKHKRSSPNKSEALGT